MCRPELKLRVPGRAQTHEVALALRDDVERRDDLRVTAIEPFGQPQHGGERPDRPPQTAFERPVPVMALLRRRLAMIARQEGNNLDLLRIEPAQLAVLDQIVRMPVMPL